LRLLEQYSGAIAPHPLSLIATDERDTAPENGNDQALDADSLAGSAEHCGPTMFARIGMLRALNRRVQREFNSSGKDVHWGGDSRNETHYEIHSQSFAISYL
jgi:hypothetical protein